MSLSYIVDAPRTPLSLSMKAFEFAEMVEEAQGCGQEGHSIGNLVNDASQRLVLSGTVGCECTLH